MLRAWIDGPLTRPGKVAEEKRFVIETLIEDDARLARQPDEIAFHAG